MAEIWKPQPIEVYQSWLDAIKDEALDKLTAWEITFIESIESQLTYKNLSEKQAEILERIYASKTK